MRKGDRTESDSKAGKIREQIKGKTIVIVTRLKMERKGLIQRLFDSKMSLSVDEVKTTNSTYNLPDFHMTNSKLVQNKEQNRIK